MSDQPNFINNDGVKFEAIEPDDLASVPVLSQAFDNQWLPIDLLTKAIKAGKVSPKLEQQREELVRAEYIRSLINGEQVVINRAFIYNNQIIFRDYLPVPSNSDTEDIRKAKENREAFMKLLQDKVLVPYLFKEKSPIEPLKFSTISFDEWEKVCLEVQNMQCVRISWNDKENDTKTEQKIAGRFTSFALTIGSPERDFDKYTEDLGLEASSKNEFRKRLRTVMQRALDLLNEKESVTREDLYKEFITIDGTLSVDRRYDKTKPFASEIKQLLDLAYGRNLPDAIDGYLLTPIDSITRTALQDIAIEHTGNPSDTFVDDLQRMLKRNVFDLIQSGRYLQSMNLLTLHDVHDVRRMDEWYKYITSLKALLKNPLSFAEGGAKAVYDNYNQLAARMSKLISDRDTQRMEHKFAKTEFIIELIIEIGGAVLSVAGTPLGNPLIQVSGAAFLAGIGKKATPFVVRFVIRDIAKHRANTNLSTSMELMKGKLYNAEQQWNKLLSHLNETGDFKEGQISPDKAANLTPPESAA